MKKIKIILIFLFFTFVANSQIKDTTIFKVVKVKSSLYFRSMPVGVYSGVGYMNDRITQNIEIGKSYGPIDIGIAFGRINQRRDSSIYLQGRVTMDACQYGIFSNEFAVGGGYVFNSKTPLMLEISSTIFAQIRKNWGIGIIVGYYDYSGNTTDATKNLYGLFFRYGLLRTDGGTLISRSKKGRRHHTI